MANAVGLYYPLWRPEEIGITKAKGLIEPTGRGLINLSNSHEELKELEPLNGWGIYKDLVDFSSEYLEACKNYPKAIVQVSR